jgi:hypothetical protein
MNFTPDMLELVLSGKKTQTRRPVKDGERCQFAGYFDFGDERGGVRAGWGLFDRNGRLKWSTLKTLAACPGRGKKAVARIRILDIQKERAIDISEDDARAEGFNSPEEFFDKLRSLYGPHTDLTAPYWALTFELVKP